MDPLRLIVNRRSIVERGGAAAAFALRNLEPEVAAPIGGFQEILNGKHDDTPEQAFYMSGTIDEVVETAAKLRS